MEARVHNIAWRGQDLLVRYSILARECSAGADPCAVDLSLFDRQTKRHLSAFEGGLKDAEWDSIAEMLPV